MCNAKEHYIELVVSCEYFTKLLDASKKTLNHVSAFIKLVIIFPRIFAIFLRRGGWRASIFSGQISGFIALIGLVHQQGDALKTRAGSFYAFPALGPVMTLAATEAYSDNDFVIRGYHVKLGVPAAF